MRFRVVSRMPYGAQPAAYLVRDLWNDYFTYVTQYRLIVADADGQHVIGDVKVGQFDQGELPSADVPEECDELGPSLFAVGLDDSY